MSLKDELVDACHRVYEKGFVSACDGNLSARLSDKRIIITPSGKCKGEVRKEDLLEIDLTGKVLEGKGKPSTEAKIHLIAYNRRPEVQSVIHCHPVYSTAFATAGESFSRPVFPEVILTLGRVPLCSYGTPSTEELPDSLLPYINDSWAMLLANHGAVTLGRSVKDAYFKMEKLEHSAKTLFAARLLGGENLISKDDVNKLYSIADSTYGIKIKPGNVVSAQAVREDMKHFVSSDMKNENVIRDSLREIIQQTIKEVLNGRE